MDCSATVNHTISVDHTSHDHDQLAGWHCHSCHLPHSSHDVYLIIVVSRVTVKRLVSRMDIELRLYTASNDRPLVLGAVWLLSPLHTVFFWAVSWKKVDWVSVGLSHAFKHLLHMQRYQYFTLTACCWLPTIPSGALVLKTQASGNGKGGERLVHLNKGRLV